MEPHVSVPSANAHSPAATAAAEASAQLAPLVLAKFKLSCNFVSVNRHVALTVRLLWIANWELLTVTLAV